MQKLLVKSLEYAVLSIILVLFLVPGTAMAEWGVRERDRLIRGTGTYFETATEGNLITIKSSEEISLNVNATGDTIRFRNNASEVVSTTTITISGLIPNKSYQKYINDFHNHEEILTDEYGSYSFNLDISSSNLIFIQSHKSTIFIADDATGGDCTTIGIWDALTKTCTLTTDLYETLQIDSDGITLDGNGHVSNGENVYSTDWFLSAGIFAFQKSNITVKNIEVTFYATGILFYQGQNNIVEYVTAHQNGEANILIWGESNDIVQNNTVRYSYDGIYIDSSTDINILNNIIEDGELGIDIGGSGGVTLKNNHISNMWWGLGVWGFGEGPLAHSIDTSNTIDGKPIYYIQDTVDQTFDGSLLNASQFYCIRCGNIILENFAPTGLNHLIFLTGGAYIPDYYRTATITNNIFNSGGFAIILDGVADIDIHDNVFGANNFGIGDSLSYGLSVYNNNFYGRAFNSFAVSSGSYPSQEFSKAMPIGGNYWASYDSIDEGCVDVNLDGVCDTGRKVKSAWDGTVCTDLFPWTTPNGWISPPTSYSTSTEPSCAIPPIDPTPDPSDTTAPVILNISTVVATSSAVISWDTDEDATGTVWYGTTTPLDVGGSATNVETLIASTSQSITIPNLQPSQTYFFVITATDTSGNIGESSENIFETLAPTPTCCSNVAFLPGLQGSDLYLGTDRLWPPTVFADDVAQLELNSSGDSINTGIYTKGIISKFYSKDIYSTFNSFMNDMVSSSTISEWKALPYDWRFTPNSIVENGIQLENEHIDLVTEIEELAATSMTGKVTLIMHSNGSLVGEVLVKKLELQGKSNLIDKFIMIGSPQLGTPKAIASLLHGFDQGILGGVIVSEKDARKLAQNMESVYNLLPSEEYMNRVVEPVIKFDSTTDLTKVWRSFWGLEINTYTELKEFLTASKVDRSKPLFNDVVSPEILRPDLVQSAQNFHQEYLLWTPPSNIEVIEIAGWGEATLKGIQYTKKEFPFIIDFLLGSKEILDMRPLLNLEGDGTVMYPSAVASNSNSNYYIDFSEYNKDKSKDEKIWHRNMPGGDPITKTLHNLLQNRPVVLDSITTIVKPTPENLGDTLLIGVHSPVSLELADNQGRTTGLDDIIGSGMKFTDEQIPNSSYFHLGEGKYITIPSGVEYTVNLLGTGTGTFTFEVSNIHLGQTTTLEIFSNIPVSTSTIVTGVINELNNVSEIALDYNGDGTVDVSIPTDSEKGSYVTFDIFSSIMNTMDMSIDIRNKLETRIKVAERDVVNGKSKLALQRLSNAIKKLEEEMRRNTMDKKQKITTENAHTLIRMIEEIKKTLVE